VAACGLPGVIGSFFWLVIFLSSAKSNAFRVLRIIVNSQKSASPTKLSDDSRKMFVARFPNYPTTYRLSLLCRPNSLGALIITRCLVHQREVVLGLNFDADDSLMKTLLKRPTPLAFSFLGFTGICR